MQPPASGRRRTPVAGRGVEWRVRAVPERNDHAPPQPAADDIASVILPARDEADWIAPCLAALLAQDAGAGRLQVIVVANGCRDATAQIARDHAAGFAARCWRLEVLELSGGSKTDALNAGDAAACGAVRIYLDADVQCSPALIGALRGALAGPGPRYATGRLRVAPAQSWVTRHYSELWQRLPFAAPGTAPGAGIFAVNTAGRARWGHFPPVISDDTFVRLQFRPDERQEVASDYLWPMPEGFARLARVRQRQDAGVDEIRRIYPALMANEGKASLGPGGLARLALRQPVSLAVYATVLLSNRLRRANTGWERGR